MSDQEMDREWQPNARRPQSTVAQMFSQELMDIFRIDNSVADLDEKVDKRKQQINTQASELEALEARIREMEARLKGQGSPIASSSSAKTGNAPPLPAKDYPVREQQKHAGSRPGTARQGQPAVPGALPPTPAGSEGEFAPSLPPSRIPPQPPGPQAKTHLAASSVGAGARPASASRANEPSAPGGDADSIKSLSESASFADYVIVPEPDGDRERDA
ncbi:hypothetical protein F5144DRAFT_594968 [Chaetomium tenue]|uniref:Uncharacterized protein n=1 Tax=Chaetomium tenue TaxID=1854479 RepID=A0ACB7NWI3_9PEZI|nr:hypothetical protein F5144DRAFT_594968 [Chaetomium globosum]